tara:strand:+ start:1596 stop:2015 length:420 start_codon:yes stop_codon:yes gene_type:complete
MFFRKKRKVKLSELIYSTSADIEREMGLKEYIIDTLILFKNLNKKKTTLKSWDKLKSSLEKGYKPKKYGYIKVSPDNTLVNGNHRVVLLNEIYHKDHIIEVEQVNPPSKFFIFFFKLYIKFVNFVDPLPTFKRGGCNCN